MSIHDGQTIWICPFCGGYNIFFENVPTCISCNEDIEWCDVVFDDGEDVY